MIQAQELVSETSKLLDNQKVLVVGIFDACFSQGHKTKTAAFVAGATYLGTKLAKKKLGPLAWVAGTIGGNKLEAFLARRNLQGKNLTPIVVCAVTESRKVYLIEWEGNHRSGTLGKILHEFHLDLDDDDENENNKSNKSNNNNGVAKVKSSRGKGLAEFQQQNNNKPSVPGGGASNSGGGGSNKKIRIECNLGIGSSNKKMNKEVLKVLKESSSTTSSKHKRRKEQQRRRQ